MSETVKIPVHNIEKGSTYAEKVDTTEEHAEAKNAHNETSQNIEAIAKARQEVQGIKTQESSVINQALAAKDEHKELQLPDKKELKKVILNNNLSVIRSRLNKREKRFSKIIHQPTINNVSEVTSRTLLRPSAILCASLFTLLGSIYYLYITKQTGYKYNFTTALALFGGGFLLGLMLEFIVRKIVRRAV